MRSILKKTARLTALLLVVTMLLTAALAQSAMVLVPSMNVYFAPSTSSEVIGKLPRYMTVDVQGTAGEWARINLNGYVGFAKIEDMVSYKYVNGRVTKDYPVMFITKDAPNTVQWRVMPAGTKVQVRGAKGSLWLISNADCSVLAYIPKTCVKIK